MKKLLFLYLAACSLAFSQGVRYDPVPVLTTASNVPPGAMAPVLAIGGAKIHVCNFPANAVPCTNYATTYTDVTLTTACTNTAQITLPGTTQCVSSTDQQGNFGFWVFPGQYAYTITIPSGQSYGPYPIMTLNNGSQMSYLQGSTGSQPRTVTNRLQDFMSVKDFGATGNGVTDDAAAIQAAVNAVCVIGGKLFLPAGTYNIGTGIVTPDHCNGIVFEGAGNYQTKGTILKWTGASGGTVFHVKGSEWDVFNNFFIDGQNSAGQGLWLEADNVTGGSSAQKIAFDNITIINCTGSPGYGLAVYGLNDDDVSQNTFTNIQLSGSTYNLYQNGIQTLGNIFFNITSFRAGLYGAYFNEGDVNLSNSTFLVDPSVPTHSLTQRAHIYWGALVSKSFLENNDYECLNTVNPAIFSTYAVADGSGTDGIFNFIGEKILWNVTGGGTVMNYVHASVLNLVNNNVTTNTLGGTPGVFYISNSIGTNSVPLNISGGNYDPTNIAFNLHNVYATVNSAKVILQDGVIQGNDGVVTSGSPVFTTTSGQFTSNMVGWGCYVGGFTSATVGANQNIVAFTSATSVTLAANAAHSATGVYYHCGRNINAGANNITTATPYTIDNSTVVSDGGNPRFWLRRNASDGTRQNWAFRADSAGAHMSILNGDNPQTATPSDFMQFVPSAGAPSSVSFPTPIRIGGVSNPLFSIYFKDISVPFASSVAAGSFSGATVTIPGAALTSGTDGCEVWGNVSVPGAFTSCFILTGNQAVVTYYNMTANPITVGTVIMRLKITKFSYTGP